jgi:hypothetical protein
MVGELHLVRLPEADAGALAIDQHFEGVVDYLRLEEDSLVSEIGWQLEAKPVEPATRVVGVPLLDP